MEMHLIVHIVHIRIDVMHLLMYNFQCTCVQDIPCLYITLCSHVYVER
jgi:hypothetical protein